MTTKMKCPECATGVAEIECKNVPNGKETPQLTWVCNTCKFERSAVWES